MPLYEYQCKKCQHRFEKIQKFSDPLVKKCPKCGGPVRQLLSAPAVQFKGTGWYVTDYARKGGVADSAKTASGDGAKDGATPPGKAPDKAEKADAKKTDKKSQKK